MMDKNPLIGKTITAFEMTNDRKAMMFVVADGAEDEALTSNVGEPQAAPVGVSCNAELGVNQP